MEDRALSASIRTASLGIGSPVITVYVCKVTSATSSLWHSYDHVYIVWAYSGARIVGQDYAFTCNHFIHVETSDVAISSVPNSNDLLMTIHSFVRCSHSQSFRHLERFPVDPAILMWRHHFHESETQPYLSQE
jgi:hypothetical protein